jgi:hypothetical protein
MRIDSKSAKVDQYLEINCNKLTFLQMLISLPDTTWDWTKLPPKKVIFQEFFSNIQIKPI